MMDNKSDRPAQEVPELFRGDCDNLRQVVSNETGDRIGIEITPEMIEAAAVEICDSGITPYPCDPGDVRLAAQQILEAALRASPVLRLSERKTP